MSIWFYMNYIDCKFGMFIFLVYFCCEVCVYFVYDK